MLPDAAAYITLLAGFGVVVLLTAWMPLILKELPLSVPIIFVFFGAVLFWLPVPGPDPEPIVYGVVTERATELVLIVALMGAGLKLDRPFGYPDVMGPALANRRQRRVAGSMAPSINLQKTVRRCGEYANRLA